MRIEFVERELHLLLKTFCKTLEKINLEFVFLLVFAFNLNYSDMCNDLV
jgi:hypothetical protein